MTLELIGEAMDAGARLAPCCELLGLDVRTVQRWQKNPEGDDARRGPRTKPGNALTPEEEQEIVELLTTAEFEGLSPNQLVPALADMGIYVASESTMYRILRKHRMLHHREPSKPRTHRRPRPRVATGSNQVWSWDITYLRSSIRGTWWRLYVILDVWSRKIVAWAIYDRECEQLAAALIQRACDAEDIRREQLVLHADNGGAMKGQTMLAKLQELGVVASFSRPRVSDDNPYSESLFRTLKYRPSYPREPFATIEDATAWVAGFVRWYNEEHRHSGIRYVTPQQRHDGDDVALLAHRQRIYEAARRRRPERWSGTTRDWKPIATVTLNPEPTRREILN